MPAFAQTRSLWTPPKLALALLLAATVMMAFPASLGAAPRGEAASTPISRVAAAQALFEQGRELLRQGRPEDACPKFEESQRLDAGLGTQFNLADCYEQLGKLASAHALFTEVAESARASGQKEREQVARERAAAVEPRASKLLIVVPTREMAGLRVERDGVEVARAQWDVPVPVDPGVHRLRAWGPGLSEWASEVTVPEGGAVHDVTVLVSEEREFFEPLHRKLGLAAAGVGVLGVSLGSFFGVRAIMKKNQAGCDGRECDSAESGDLRDEARSAGDLATVTMGIGAAGLATAAVLFWIVSEPAPENPESAETSSDPESSKSGAAKLALHPVVAPSGGGFWLRGEF
jgi:hypothetical protein